MPTYLPREPCVVTNDYWSPRYTLLLLKNQAPSSESQAVTNSIVFCPVLTLILGFHFVTSKFLSNTNVNIFKPHIILISLFKSLYFSTFQNIAMYPTISRYNYVHNYIFVKDLFSFLLTTIMSVLLLLALTKLSH